MGFMCLRIYVTGITAIDPIYVLNTSDPQSITVTCPEGRDRPWMASDTCGTSAARLQHGHRDLLGVDLWSSAADHDVVGQQ